MAGSLFESFYLIENADSPFLIYQWNQVLFRIRNKNSQDDKIWQLRAKLLRLNRQVWRGEALFFPLPDGSYRELWRTPLDKVPGTLRCGLKLRPLSIVVMPLTELLFHRNS